MRSTEKSQDFKILISYNRNRARVDVTTKVIPAITGVNGTIGKARYDSKELHKTATPGTAQILREVLM
jgi:hypothetical protein